MATKEKSKDKELKNQEPAKEPVTIKPEDYKVRHLTDEENKLLMDDNSAPEGYANIATEVEAEELTVDESEPAKAEEKPAEKVEPPKEEKKDFFERLEIEMDKPEGKEDVSDFTPREKAYFYRMRRDRKLRQQAEEDRDKALFRETKLKEVSTKKQEQEDDDPLKVLEGKEDDDFLTAGEVKKILEKGKKAKKDEEKQPDPDDASKTMQIRYLQMCEKEAVAEIKEKGDKDFYAVMELAEDLVTNDAQALKEIADRTKKGENPALVMYEVIKSNKDFEVLYPAAELRAKARAQKAEKKDTPVAPSSAPALTPEDKAKEEKAKQAEKALEENSKQTKTTAHASSREGKPASELTIDEISRMSDLEFARLPRQTRERYLRLYGGEPAKQG